MAQHLYMIVIEHPLYFFLNINLSSISDIFLHTPYFDESIQRRRKLDSLLSKKDHGGHLSILDHFL